jgi:hypothetical protein
VTRFGRAVIDLLQASIAADVAPPLPVDPADTRPIAFAPQGRRKPMFFLHIPKTSGSSCNAMLRVAYGRLNFVDHAEVLLPDLLRGLAPTRRVDCVSAHVPMCRWVAYRGTRAYPVVTLLRDPWARLVSHINWVNKFNRGEPLPSGRSGPVVARVAAAIAATDFTRRRQVKAFRDAVMKEEEFNAFDNMQVRMLVTGSHRATFKRLEPGDAAQALEMLRSFAVVGLCEDQPGFAAAVGQYMGRRVALPAEPANRTRPDDVVLTQDNDMVREVLAGWLSLDHEIYDAIVRGRA